MQSGTARSARLTKLIEKWKQTCLTYKMENLGVNENLEKKWTKLMMNWSSMRILAIILKI